MKKPARARFSFRLWPKGLTGQIVLLILLTLFVSQAIHIFWLAGARVEAFRRGVAGPLVEQTAAAAELLKNGEQTSRVRLARLLEGPNRQVRFEQSPRASRLQTSPFAERLAARLSRETGLTTHVEAQFGERRFGRLWQEEQESPRRFSEPRSPSRYIRFDRLVFSLELKQGEWLNIVWQLPERELDWVWASLFSNLILAGFLSGLAIIALRRVVRPIKALARASQALGRGERLEPLPDKGPLEVRQATRAFNNMQQQITRFVRDRTEMLAAISHDLRTPITSLRLRAELLEEEEARGNILRILDEMQAMSESVLDFAREDAAKEAFEALELNAFLEACIAPFHERGLPVTLVKAQDRLVIQGRSLSLKRALNNLLENAVFYGGRADVEVKRQKETAQIIIKDAGSGIAEALHEEVFRPFVRLESSRNRETGGTGLGLSIARSVIRAHGGDISLKNADEGGLEVIVDLPL